METLQRLASERQLTLIEAKEMMLWTKPQDLLMDKRCWLESAYNLVSIMPPPTEAEVKHYNLSSYPPKLIPRLGAQPVPSTSTTSIHQLMLIGSTANPPASTVPQCPEVVSTSTSSRVVLPPVHDLIRAIFRTDPSPTPNSTLPYLLATRPPLSAILMGPPCTTMRPGSSVESLQHRPTTHHPKTGRTLCLLGSYGTKDLEELTSRSQTCRDTPDSPTTSRS